MIRNRMSMSCHRGTSRPRCAHCFENTAFRQLNSQFPSSLRCGSRRSIVACFRSRASCTCLWTFAQRLGQQWTREQREQSRYKDFSLKSPLVRIAARQLRPETLEHETALEKAKAVATGHQA
jgi:hypothetical protein